LKTLVPRPFTEFFEHPVVGKDGASFSFSRL
jgi:hypothetical protein